MTERFFGKFRGAVTNIQDPMMQGRIRAKVPDVLGDLDSGWATACFPFTGTGMGFFGLPKVGSGVWIEFEAGDITRPIWVGGWVGTSSEMPSELLTSPYKKTMIKTEGGNMIILDDSPDIGGITLQTSSGQKIVMNSAGIEVSDGLGGVFKPHRH